jgi:hypothetical protein
MFGMARDLLRSVVQPKSGRRRLRFERPTFGGFHFIPHGCGVCLFPEGSP